MPTFDARIATDDGVRTIPIVATDSVSAERLASKKGQVLSLKKKWSLDLSRGMNASERNVFMRRLSTMVGSKMPLTTALRLISSTYKGRIKNAADAMLDKLDQGLNLADCIAADTKNFPLATSALIKAGMQSGESSSALRDAANFEEEIASIQKGAMKEIFLAIGTFFAAFAMMYFTVYHLGPQVLDNPMFKNNEAVNVGWAETAGIIVTWGMGIVAVIFAFFLWLGTAGRVLFPNIADKIILRVPFYKDLVLSRNSYVILYKFGLLIGSGVRIEESLALTCESTPKGAMRTDFERALQFVRQGKAWPNALDNMHPTDRATFAIATDAKDLAHTLNEVANQYRDLYMSRMRSFAPALQGVSAICITFAGIEMFLLTILPMLQFSASIN